MEVHGGLISRFRVAVRLENVRGTTQGSVVKPEGVGGAKCAFYFQVLVVLPMGRR